MDDQIRTDADLARAWEGGDERGFDSIVTRYAPMVYARCRRALGAADADDATQAVFLVLVRKRAQAAASPALAAWLLTVAGNVVRNASRDRERRRRAESATPTPSLASPIIEDTDMHGLPEHLDACVAELPKHERDAVVLHHLAGHSIAEVARHTGSGLSTVKDRLARGLARLRRLLGDRGIELGAAPLVVQLNAEALARVPVHVLGQLHHLASITSTSGSAAATAALSARVIRWSRQGLSPMTYVAIIGTPLLLTLGAVSCSMFAAESGSVAAAKVQAAPMRVVPAAPPSALIDLGAIDPEHAHSWHVLRWNDGARSAERAKHLPELALLPSAGADILAVIASMREGAVAINLEAMFPDAERVRQLRFQKELATLPPADQARRVHDEIARVTAETKKGGEAEKAATGSGMPGVEGWLTFADGTAPGIDKVQAIASALPFLMTAAPVDGGVDLHGRGGDIQVRQTGPRFDVHSTTALSPAALLPAGEMSSRIPDADLEMSMLMDPGTSASIMTLGSVAVTVTADGLHLLSNSPWVDAEHRRASETGVRVDRRRFAGIPAQALMAAVVAMNPDETRLSNTWQSLFDGLVLPIEMGSGDDASKQARLTVTKAAVEALRGIDGSLVAWLEPGSPMPIITLEADLPKSAADALIASTGQTADADGTVCVSAGMAMLWMGWHDGRLVCTTNPGGLGAVDRSGGFTSQPEIVRALAAMPKASPTVCALMRPAAMMHTAGPFVGMLAPDQLTHVAEYEKRLSADTAYGFLTIVPSSEGVRMEASGMLALIGGAYLAAQMAPKHANN